ncbi:hypothetical protein D0T12_21175 [Actinomadura spongiicola]|uniref:Uncharacterized protein n=1 Tax=Actinomadura spongiicola TaxID=2303421 RepID=A0A372GDZ0_9ACTN|nr:hypothetical protein D0T12_21175 [Actinomadura spongiicola]
MRVVGRRRVHLREDGFVCDVMESATLVTPRGVRLDVDDVADAEVMGASRKARTSLSEDGVTMPEDHR